MFESAGGVGMFSNRNCAFCAKERFNMRKLFKETWNEAMHGSKTKIRGMTLAENIEREALRLGKFIGSNKTKFCRIA